MAGVVQTAAAVVGLDLMVQVGLDLGREDPDLMGPEVRSVVQVDLKDLELARWVVLADPLV